MGNISSCNTTHQAHNTQNLAAHKRNEEVASFFSTINPFKYKKQIGKTKQQMFKQKLADKTKTKNKSKRTRF
jgi:hypothetical protein